MAGFVVVVAGLVVVVRRVEPRDVPLEDLCDTREVLDGREHLSAFPPADRRTVGLGAQSESELALGEASGLSGAGQIRCNCCFHMPIRLTHRLVSCTIANRE